MTAPLFPSAAGAASWAAALPEGACGRAGLRYWASTDSTQDRAFDAAAAGAPGGAVFLAEEQTAGRGRQGRSWSAPAGTSLLLSVLLRPAPPAKAAGRTALGSALAACRAVEKLCAAHPAVKWPNDLLLGGRKFGGILLEVRGEVAALGVGLNVLQAPGDFPESVAGVATSLAAELREPPDRRRLLGLLLSELGRLFGEPPVPWEEIRAEVAARLAWRGGRVRVGDEHGVLTGLDEQGRLVVELAGGGRTAVASGTLELTGP